MTRSMTAKIRAAYPVSTLTSLPNFEDMAVEEFQPEPLTIHAPVEEDSDDDAVEFKAPYFMYWTGYRIPANECSIVWMWADMGRCCTGLLRDAGCGHRRLAEMFRHHAFIGGINDFKFEFEKHTDMLDFIETAGPIFREEFRGARDVTFICHAWDTPSPKIDENVNTFKFEIARPLFS